MNREQPEVRRTETVPEYKGDLWYDLYDLYDLLLYILSQNITYKLLQQLIWNNVSDPTGKGCTAYAHLKCGHGKMEREVWDNEEVCETKTSKADLGSVVNMGFGSLSLWGYPDRKTTDITAAGAKKELKISHMYVGMHTHQKRKKKRKRVQPLKRTEKGLYSY